MDAVHDALSDKKKEESDISSPSKHQDQDDLDDLLSFETPKQESSTLTETSFSDTKSAPEDPDDYSTADFDIDDLTEETPPSESPEQETIALEESDVSDTPFADSDSDEEDDDDVISLGDEDLADSSEEDKDSKTVALSEDELSSDSSDTKTVKDDSLDDFQIDEENKEDLDLPEEDEELSQKTVLFEFEFQPRLELKAGNMPNKIYPLDKAIITVGRAKECDVVLFDSNCSRNQAEILREGPDFYVVDLDSANGTKINDFLIHEKVKLTPHDTLAFGEIEFIFQDGVEMPTAKQPFAKVIEANPLDLIEPLPPWKDFLIKNQKRVTIYGIFLLIGIIALSVRFYQQGNSNQAESELTETQPLEKAKSPSDEKRERRIKYLVNQGNFLFNNANYKEALEKFDMALQLDPTNESIRKMRDKSQSAIALQGEIDKAKEHAQSLKSKEIQIKQLERSALVFIKQQNYIEALKTLKRLEKIDPESEIVKKQIPIVDEKLKLSKSEKLKGQRLREMVKERSELAETYYAQQSEYMAILELRRLLKEDLDGPTRQKLQLKINQWDQELKNRLKNKIETARTFWENGEKLQAKRLITEILGEYPDYSEAKEEYEKINSQLQAEAFQYYNDGRVHEANDDISAAIDSYEKVLGLLEASDEYHKKAMEKLMKLRRFEQ